MVFVDHVVTMQRDSPDEVAEPEVDRRLHVVLQPENIFPPFRNESGACWWIAIDRKGLELFEVHVNRVLPAARVVLKNPLLD